MGFLDLEGVQKVYGPNTVVRHFDLEIARGEFVSFLGPSGCGKTTTLRMIAGFEVPTAGTIRIDGKDVTDLKPNQRNVGMVFQSYALFPNLTVAENIGFGLKVARQPKEAIRAARRGDARDHQAAAARRPLSLPALRRPAAARRARPRACGQAVGAPPRRAALRARRQDPRLAPPGDPLAPARARHHHRLRHPRPGRGAVDVRPHRGDERRPDGAGRHALRHLQLPVDALRRLLRRHAQHHGRARSSIRPRAASRSTGRRWCRRAA